MGSSTPAHSHRKTGDSFPFDSPVNDLPTGEMQMNTKADAQKKGPFLTDIEEIRRRAREHIEKGAVTLDYKGDIQTVLRVLNEALATELVCVLRYKRHHYMAKGIHSQAVAAEFLEHANEEQGHADQIAERIMQLDGEPNFSPEGMLTRSHSEYVEGATLLEMIREDLIAERIAIESYGEIVRYLGDNDPTSRRMMEGILANEEEHADDMKTLLETIGKDEKQREQ
jgi:bacterioferritin